jgi:hypothetical protein
MKTTYQNLWNWYQTSQAWQHLFQAEPRNGYIRLKPDREPVNLPISNFWHTEITREFREKGFQRVKVYDFFTLNGRKLSEDEKLEILPSIYISYWLTTTLDWDISFTLHGLGDETRKTVTPPKKMELTRKNIVNFVIDYVNRKYVLPGWYGQFQIENGFTKKQAIAVLREQTKRAYKNIKRVDSYEMYCYMERHYNIVPEESLVPEESRYDLSSWEELLLAARQYVQQHGKPRETLEIRETPDITRVFNELEAEIERDDLAAIEAHVYNELEPAIYL